MFCNTNGLTGSIKVYIDKYLISTLKDIKNESLKKIIEKEMNNIIKKFNNLHIFTFEQCLVFQSYDKIKNEEKNNDQSANQSDDDQRDNDERNDEQNNYKKLNFINKYNELVDSLPYGFKILLEINGKDWIEFKINDYFKKGSTSIIKYIEKYIDISTNFEVIELFLQKNMIFTDLQLFYLYKMLLKYQYEENEIATLDCLMNILGEGSEGIITLILTEIENNYLTSDNKSNSTLQLFSQNNGLNNKKRTVSQTNKNKKKVKFEEKKEEEVNEKSDNNSSSDDPSSDDSDNNDSDNDASNNDDSRSDDLDENNLSNKMRQFIREKKLRTNDWCKRISKLAGHKSISDSIIRINPQGKYYCICCCDNISEKNQIPLHFITKNHKRNYLSEYPYDKLKDTFLSMYSDRNIFDNEISWKDSNKNSI